MRVRKFASRVDAGRWLGERLALEAGPGTTVLALPRGGVQVGAEVARLLGASLDVLVVRKLGLPRHEELAMGAVGPGGVRVLDDAVVTGLRIRPEVVEEVTRRERLELARREALYRGARPEAALAGRTLVVVDDGVATGATMLAAVEALRVREPSRIVVAVPIAGAEAYEKLTAAADEVVCAFVPWPFHSVSFWYDDFAQVSDADVARLLREAGGPSAPAA